MQLPVDWVLVITRSESCQSMERYRELVPSIGGVEVRLDLWHPDGSIASLPSDLSVIVTDRGGLGDDVRSAARDQLCRSLGAILDVDPLTDAPAPADLDWIYSCHRPQQMEDPPEQQIQEAQRLGASAAKIVFLSADLDQSRSAIALSKCYPDFPVISFTASVDSAVDRLTALDAGQRWNYLRPTDDDSDALSNVPSIDEIRWRCRIRERDSHR